MCVQLSGEDEKEWANWFLSVEWIDWYFATLVCAFKKEMRKLCFYWESEIVVFSFEIQWFAIVMCGLGIETYVGINLKLLRSKNVWELFLLKFGQSKPNKNQLTLRESSP